MERPPIRRARTDDGVEIAYWAIGHGPFFVELPALPHSHIGVEWDLPEYRRGYELAAEVRTVVRYDGRGTGLSQRSVEDFSLEALCADLDAVLDDVGAERAALMGIINAAPIAIAYAVRHPERVSELVLWCPVVDGAEVRANPQLQAARQVIEKDWGTFCMMVAHSLLGWAEGDAARRFAALVRASITPATLLALVSALHEVNVWDDLPRVQCPTLVLHRPELPLISIQTVERVVERIPDARLALLEGASTAPYIGDWRTITRIIADFLGAPLEPAPGKREGRALRLLSMKSDTLTDREQQIVSLLARGWTNRQIAAELVLAEKTVEHHIGRILVKLDLRSRTQIAVYAVEHGLGDQSA